MNLLRELKHENIVKYHERVVDKKRQILYLIMEYCEGGDLAGLIKRYSKDGYVTDVRILLLPTQYTKLVYQLISSHSDNVMMDKYIYIYIYII